MDDRCFAAEQLSPDWLAYARLWLSRGSGENLVTVTGAKNP